MAKSKIGFDVVADATGAIKSLSRLDGQVVVTTKNLSKMSKAVIESNNNGNGDGAFKELTDQLNRNAEAYKIVYTEQEATKKSLKEYKNALESALKSGGFTAEQNAKLAGSYQELVKQANKYEEAVRKSKTGVASYGKKVVELLKNIMGFQLIIATVRKGLTATTTFFKDSVKYAAEAEQIYSKLGTVFTGFEKTADKASKNLAQNIGVAKTTAASALSTIGDLLQAQGMSVAESLETATVWAEKLQDIIAFKDINMSLEEFAQNFMSGAAGNTRNFRTFGSIVKESAVEAELAKQSLDKLTGSELELAKMTIRAEMALKQQENAIGATGREWDTMLSVSRRYEQSLKRLKEDIGDWMSKPMKDMKIFFTEAYDQLDTFIRKYRSWAGQGNGDIAFDIKNSKSDRDAFRSALFGRGKIDMLSTEYLQGETSENISKYVADLNNVLNTYGATLKDAFDVLNEYVKKTGSAPIEIDPEILKQLQGDENKRQLAKEEQEAIEKRNAEVDKLLQVSSNFLETLRSVPGVLATTGTNIPIDGGWTATEGTVNLLKGAMETQSTSAIVKATSNIFEATADTMKKSMEYAFGSFSDQDLVKAQMESLQKLYEVAWNKFRTEGSEGGNGVTSAEQDALDNIVKKYKELNKVLEDYKAEEEKKVQTLKDEQTAAERRAGMALGTYTWKDSYKDQMTALKQQLSDAFVSGMDPMDKEVQDIIKSYKALNGQLVASEEAEQKLKEIKEKVKKLEEDRQAYFQSFNPFQPQVDAYKTGQEMFTSLSIGGAEIGGTLAGILGVLVDILKQTEVFSKLSSFVTDYIIPVFDALFKPLLPAIKAVGMTVQTLLECILMPLFPVIKLIAEVVVIIMTPIRVMLVVLKNIKIAVHNIFQRLLHPITGGNQMGYESITQVLDQQLDMLESIHKATMQVASNTEGNSDKLSAYSEMYSKGMINASEYNALLNGLSGVRHDRLQSWENGTYYNGSNGQTIVYSGGISFTVNGTNLSADEIFREFENWLAKQNRGGAMLTA